LRVGANLSVRGSDDKAALLPVEPAFERRARVRFVAEGKPSAYEPERDRREEQVERPKMATLVKLGETDLTVADPAEDIRGRTVVDRDGAEIGEVQSLLIDEQEKKVRMLEVQSGGLLGLGGETRLVPVDAITRIDEDTVQIDQTREHVHASPPYDPELAVEESYYGDLYGYYGYAPFWTPGYTYPAYPYFR
jgi:sporulation protein YlmC with PRC-barrel domain